MYKQYPLLHVLQCVTLHYQLIDY